MALGEPHKPVEHRLTADENGLRPRTAALPGSRLDMSAHPTDFKFAADEARDAGGRWTAGGSGGGKKPSAVDKAQAANTPEARNLVRAKTTKHFVDKMKSPVSDKLKRVYAKSAEEAFRGFSAKAQSLAMSVKKVKITSPREIAKAMGDPFGDSFAAYYSFAKDTIAIGDDNIDARVIAHEAAHAIDAGNLDYSDTKEWRSIYRDEFKNKTAKALGSYSRTNAQEAFAKAMEHTTNSSDYKTLKTKCPRAHDFLIKNELIERWQS